MQSIYERYAGTRGRFTQMEEEETDEAGVVLVSRSMRWAHRGIAEILPELTKASAPP